MSSDDTEHDEYAGIRADTMRERGRSRQMQHVGAAVGRSSRTFDRAAWFRDYYGLEPGVSPCESCGRVVEVADHGRCARCDRPYPVRCDGLWFPDPTLGQVHVKCTNRIEPKAYTVSTRSGIKTLWDETERMCMACKRRARHDERMERWAVAFRVGGPGREEYARNKIIPDILDYQETEWRSELDESLNEWLVGKGPPCLFVHGSVGSGKTTAILRASFRAFVVEQVVGSFVYVEQDDLLDAYKAQYGDVAKERREEARMLLDLFETAELAVVDEMFSAHDQKNPWTATASQDIGARLRRRFQARRRTLFSSNMDPCMDGDLADSLWTKAFDDRMADRAREVMRVVHVQGPSMRGITTTKVVDLDAYRRVTVRGA